MTAAFTKFGKSFRDILALKASFTDEDAKHAARHDAVGALLRSQPRRTACKVCETPIAEDAGPDFVSHDTPYHFCPNCGHLNGLHDDTAEFAHSLYVDPDAGYAGTYVSAAPEAFAARLSAIYAPKAAFLRDTLVALGRLDGADVLDVGAGCGYFVKACRDAGLDATGLEPSAEQVADAERFVGPGAVRVAALDDTPTHLANTTARVVSMIGVLEHLREPHAALEAINRSTAEALYLSIPMVGVSTFLEAVSPDVFNRHLGGGHTHLFTESSLDHLCDRYGWSRAAEWWFGSDIMDLRRHTLVKLERSGASPAARKAFVAAFDQAADPMQLALDETRASSELHVVLQRR